MLGADALQVEWVRLALLARRLPHLLCGEVGLRPRDCLLLRAGNTSRRCLHGGKVFSTAFSMGHGPTGNTLHDIGFMTRMNMKSCDKSQSLLLSGRNCRRHRNIIVSSFNLRLVTR